MELTELVIPTFLVRNEAFVFEINVVLVHI